MHKFDVTYNILWIDRIRKHYALYEPAMQQLKQKYEVGDHTIITDIDVLFFILDSYKREDVSQAGTW